MKVLITGVDGFIGKNLRLFLLKEGIEVLGVDLVNLSDLGPFALQADVIVHLAGVNRPKDIKEFKEGNVTALADLLEILAGARKKTPIVLASSTQAALANPYGQSKKEAEELLFARMKAKQGPAYVFRFANVFGKWCRPGYNSVVATFCHNTAHHLPSRIDDPSIRRSFIYIDDVCQAILEVLKEPVLKGSEKIMEVTPAYVVSIGELHAAIEAIEAARLHHAAPPLNDPFIRKLQATYLSYLEPKELIRPLRRLGDKRGSFTEFIRQGDMGQVSLNVIGPRECKGHHYHHTKTERFFIIKGECLIHLRKIGSTHVDSLLLKEDEPSFIDIPPGVTHALENTGEDQAMVLIWASEVYDEARPDTIRENVFKDVTKEEER